MNHTPNLLLNLPSDLMQLIYNKLSSHDHWSLFKTHVYFQHTLKKLLNRFKLSYVFKGDYSVWLRRFPNLKTLEIQQSRVDLPSLDASCLPRQLQSLIMPSIPHFIICNPVQLPMSLTQLVLPGSELRFGNEQYLPPQLASLQIFAMQLDAAHHFPPLPNTLTYLHVSRLTVLDCNDDTQEYYHLPEGLLHLHAPFPENLSTLKQLPRRLLSLCAVHTFEEDNEGWQPELSARALPPNLTNLTMGGNIDFLDTDFDLLPISLITLIMKGVEIIDKDGYYSFDTFLLCRYIHLTSLTLELNGVLTLHRYFFYELPPTLVTLNLEFKVEIEYIDLDDLYLGGLPRSLTHLTLGHYFSITTDNLSLLPPLITDLSLLCDVKPCLTFDHVSHLEQLRLLKINSRFDPCSLSSLPPSLRSLTFLQRKMSDINGRKQHFPDITRNFFALLPRQLKRLTLHPPVDYDFDSSSDNELLCTLPSSLIDLDLGVLLVHDDAWQHLPSHLRSLRANFESLARRHLTHFKHFPSSLHTLQHISSMPENMANMQPPPALVNMNFSSTTHHDPGVDEKLPFWARTAYIQHHVSPRFVFPPHQDIPASH